MKKIKPQEILAKISKKINFQELLTLKTDFRSLVVKKSSLKNLQELLTKITRNKNKLIFTILVISTILFLDFFFGLRFQMRALGSIRPKIIRLRRNLQNLNSDLTLMQSHQKGLDLGGVKELLPLGQTPWLIEEISRLANQQKVVIFQIKPLRQLSVEKTSRKSTPTEESPLILINLEISAGYHQLGRFLADLENHPVFLDVEQLDIKQSLKRPFEHSIKLKLKTYVSE